MGSLGTFLKKYLSSVVALAVLLIVLFWLTNFIGRRAPAPLSTISEKVGALASGQAYQFSA